MQKTTFVSKKKSICTACVEVDGCWAEYHFQSSWDLQTFVKNLPEGVKLFEAICFGGEPLFGDFGEWSMSEERCRTGIDPQLKALKASEQRWHGKRQKAPRATAED